MFGFTTAKELVKKSLNAVRLFQTIDLERMKKNIDEIAKFKEKIKIPSVYFGDLINTDSSEYQILIMVILFKK